MSKCVDLYYYQVVINAMEKKEENWSAWREDLLEGKKTQTKHLVET